MKKNKLKLMLTSLILSTSILTNFQPVFAYTDKIFELPTENNNAYLNFSKEILSKYNSLEPNSIIKTSYGYIVFSRDMGGHNYYSYSRLTKVYTDETKIDNYNMESNYKFIRDWTDTHYLIHSVINKKVYLSKVSKESFYDKEEIYINGKINNYSDNLNLLDFVALNDNNIIMVMSDYNQTDGTGEISFVKLDENFNLISKVDYPLTAEGVQNLNSTGINMLKDENENIVVNFENKLISVTKDLNENFNKNIEIEETILDITAKNNEIFVITKNNISKYDNNCNLVNTVKVLRNSDTSDNAQLVRIINDEIIVLSQMKNEEGKYLGVLDVYDNNLKLKDTKEILVNNSSITFSDLIVDENNNLVIIGKMDGGENYDYGFVINVSLGEPKKSRNIRVNAEIQPSYSLAVDTNHLDFGDISPLKNKIKTLNVNVKSNIDYDMWINGGLINWNGTKEIPLSINVNNNGFQPFERQTYYDEYDYDEYELPIVTEEKPTEGKNYKIDFKTNTNWNTEVNYYSGIVKISILPTGHIRLEE